ncbi:carbohydrate-binding module family 20 [Piedraia hortae CBS 480.64]|uniref:laccase n=1 Tax=Piedraia hortae CBS 480.64 TaxID=1314780 RepID=A0A6A7CAN8_9PEZI|nr:carbohydrate-binding module family 20 [Piedraia hortae CBS 480.64]
MRLPSFIGILALAGATIAADTPLCPTFNGKTYTDSNGQQYNVKCGVQNSGRVLDTTSATTTLGQCAALCDARTGCVAVLFHAFVNTCDFLSSVGTNTTNSNFNLAVKKVSPVSSDSPSSTGSPQISVTFTERVTTVFGESVRLVGSATQLGSWDPANGLAMSANGYTDSNPIWSLTVSLPAGLTFQYKYVVVGIDGTIRWEADPNRSFVVPFATGQSSATSTANTWQSVSSSSTTSSLTLSTLVTNTIKASTTTSVASTATCTHSASRRDCWSKGFDINTDFDSNWPKTGRTVSYQWTITNTTLSPDGIQRPAFLINNQYPGPRIEANWGDTIQVTVKNSLTNNGTSIHWHGLRQYHNNGQDGVPGVTECPLAPGQTKTYTFVATQYGTSWYHSHFSCQYGDGVLGPIVIHGPATSNYDIDLGPLPLTDWYRPTVNALAARAEHADAPAPVADNGLINGTNTSPSGGKRAVSRLTTGKRHRVRLLNTAVDNHFTVSLDGHQMEVIASDFVPIKPFNTTSLFLGIGQRYDVIITADQTPGAYWFRAEMPSSGECGNNFSGDNIRSIFAYPGFETATPSSQRQAFSARCTDETNLIPHWNSFVPRGKQGTFTEFTTAQLQQKDNDGSVSIYWQINGSHLMVDWNVPTVQHVRAGDTNFGKTANLVNLPDAGVWTYWVIQEIAGNPYELFLPHPIHLHGHDFYVLGAGNTAWTADSAASLNYDNPPRRDVAMLNSGGWLAIAFPTDNPGAWVMHCHIAWHADEGLSVQFLESPSSMLSTSPLPSDYDQQCNAWKSYYSNSFYKQRDSGI